MKVEFELTPKTLVSPVTRTASATKNGTIRAVSNAREAHATRKLNRKQKALIKHVEKARELHAELTGETAEEPANEA